LNHQVANILSNCVTSTLNFQQLVGDSTACITFINPAYIYMLYNSFFDLHTVIYYFRRFLNIIIISSCCSFIFALNYFFWSGIINMCVQCVVKQLRYCSMVIESPATMCCIQMVVFFILIHICSFFLYSHMIIFAFHCSWN
jgi:hypothetical protein